MASTEPARVSDSLTSYKRGCLWYGLVASAIIAVLFVLGLFLALESPNTSVPAHSILVSAQERTYLEVVDEQVPEGFPDYHYEMRIYYTRLGGWFEPTRQVLVLCKAYPIANAAIVGFHWAAAENGQLTIEVKRPKTKDEIWLEVNQSLPSMPDDARRAVLLGSLKARVATRDSLLLTVFTPPANFPTEEAVLHRASDRCIAN
jgi:hypothetical protein